MGKCYLMNRPNLDTPTIPSRQRLLLPRSPSPGKTEAPAFISLPDDEIDCLAPKPVICIEGTPLRRLLSLLD